MKARVVDGLYETIEKFKAIVESKCTYPCAVYHNEEEVAYQRANYANRVCADHPECAYLHWLQHECLEALQYLYGMDARRVWMQRPFDLMADGTGISLQRVEMVLYRLLDNVIQHKAIPSSSDFLWAAAKYDAHLQANNVNTNDIRAEDEKVLKYATVSKVLGGVTGSHKTQDIMHGVHEGLYGEERWSILRQLSDYDFYSGRSSVTTMWNNFHWACITVWIRAMRAGKPGTPLMADAVLEPYPHCPKLDVDGPKIGSMIELIADMANMNDSFLEQGVHAALVRKTVKSRYFNVFSYSHFVRNECARARPEVAVVMEDEAAPAVAMSLDDAVVARPKRKQSQV
jgi:hypothetical protein